MSLRIVIATMVYNEGINLPIWVRHYRAHCPGASLVVLDHGSNDGSTDGLQHIDCIPLPRGPFDEGERARIVTELQHGLLENHDVVIFTDTDEMLVADPRRHTSLTDFLGAVPDEVIAPVGLNVLHAADEPAIDVGRPLLRQRRYVRFDSGMCKPGLSRVPLCWQPGFHHADRRPIFRPDLFLFHLRYLDRTLALRRLAETRAIEWSDSAIAKGHSAHHRAPDARYVANNFDAPSRLIQSGAVKPFAFQDEVDRLVLSLDCRDGNWIPDPPFWSGRIAAIPEELRSVL